MKQLLSVSSDAKTIKGEKQGFLTGILYMAPYTMSGTNLCPMAKVADCYKACLFTAGRAGIFPMIPQARLNKTNYFLNDRAGFMVDLVKSIKSLSKKAAKLNLTPIVRLNGTTDIRWELVSFSVDGVWYENIMKAFPNIQFYDYTKIYNRHSIPSNYDLTFSYSGVVGYQKYVQKALDKGMRVAVVFRTRQSIPSMFLGLDVVSGDNSDLRHLDPQGVIVALYAKGAAKKDMTGFVVDTKVNKLIQIKVA